MKTGAEDELLLVRPDGAWMETASWQVPANDGEQCHAAYISP